MFVVLVIVKGGGLAQWRDEIGPVCFSSQEAAEERMRAEREKGKSAFVLPMKEIY